MLRREMVLPEDVQDIQDYRIGIEEMGRDFREEYDNIQEMKESEESSKYFYDGVCDITHTYEFGTNEFGAFSLAGYGDGTYGLWVVNYNGEIVAAKIVYIEKD